MRFFLVKDKNGDFSLVANDQVEIEIVGKMVMAVFEMGNFILDNAVLNELVDKIAKGLLNYKTEAYPSARVQVSVPANKSFLSLENLHYQDFVGKGRKFFNEIFPNKDKLLQEKIELLKSIVHDGWQQKKPNKKIAEEFNIKEKTFACKLLEWGIRSNSRQFQKEGPFRPRLCRMK